MTGGKLLWGTRNMAAGAGAGQTEPKTEQETRGTAVAAVRRPGSAVECRI